MAKICQIETQRLNYILISTKHKLPRPSLEIPLSARNTLLTAPHLMTHLYNFDLTNSNSSLAPSISRKGYKDLCPRENLLTDQFFEKFLKI